MTANKIPTLIPFLLPRLGHVLWLALFFGVLGLGPAMMNVDGDLGRHLTIGRYILESGHIPTVDVFSYSLAGQPLTPHEWLAEVIFALAERLLGLDGVVLVTALVIASAFSLVFRQALRQSGSILLSLAFTILAAGAASLHWLTRPHIFTFLFLALWVGVLEDLRAGKRTRWMWLPALMLLWANLHGAFIAGFVVWAIYLAGWAWERWIERRQVAYPADFLNPALLGGGASLAVTLLNPSGIHLWATSLGYLRNAYLVGHTAEYLSPDFHASSSWLFLLLILLAVFLFGVSRKPRPPQAVFMVAAWLVMGLVSARNIPLFAILAAPILAAASADWLAVQGGQLAFLARVQALDERLRATEAALRGVVWPALGVLAAGLVLSAGTPLDFQRQGNRFDATVFPVTAVDWLEEHPQPGEMFNYFPWGGYLLYREWPDQRVFIDGQTDFYGEALTRQYETVLALGEGWQDVLSEYRVGWVIFPVDAQLVAELVGEPGWQLVYQDATAAILRRR